MKAYGKCRKTKYMSSLISVLLCMIMISAYFPIVVPAAAAESYTVDFSSPAICATVGETVDLSLYSVEFTAGNATPAQDIAFSSAELAIADNKIRAGQKGVYALTATSGTLSKVVYLVVKGADETEYVLYEEAYDSASSIDNYRIVQKDSGTTVKVENGALILDGASSDKYVRILLPSFIDDFGNYSIEADVNMTNAKSDSRWMSLMFRVQNADYPYWQACLRKNATLANGLEIAERTAANAWNVTHKTACGEALSPAKSFVLRAKVRENTAAAYMNGDKMLSSSAVTYDRGAVGFQVRGTAIAVNHVRITVFPTTEEELNIANITPAASNLVMAPTVVGTVENILQLNDIQADVPSVAMAEIDINLNITAKNGDVITSIEGFLSKLDKKIIPAFYVRDEGTAAAVAARLKALEAEDCFVVSDNAAAVKKARDGYKFVRGVLDFSEQTGLTYAHISEMSSEANKAGARVIIIPSYLALKKNVTKAQSLFTTVWVANDNDSISETVFNITSGANGILTSNTQQAYKCFTEYFNEGTLIRSSHIIGHRGVPSLEQENTLAGSIRAYELGATMIENDIYITADDVVVVMHDQTIDRTTDGTGDIETMTYEQLSKYYVDSNASASKQPIPTLEDYFKEFKGKDMTLVIELKTSKARVIKPLAELIEKYDILDQVTVITFEYALIDDLREAIPGVSVGYLISANMTNENDPSGSVNGVLGCIQQYDATFNPSYNKGALGSAFLTAAAYRGITVWPWTVNSRSELDKYIGYGTNGITTNYSQYVSDYIFEVNAAQGEISFSKNTSCSFDIYSTTYARKTQKANAFMTIIDGNQTVKYENGMLSAAESGEATVIFGVSYRTSLAEHTVYTQPVKINVTAGGASAASIKFTVGQNTVTSFEIEAGASVTLPKPTEGLVTDGVFVGWLTSDGKNLLPSGAQYNINNTGDVEFKALFAEFKLVDGAAVSLAEDNVTLRFTAGIKASDIKAITDTGSAVEFGMYINTLEYVKKSREDFGMPDGEVKNNIDGENTVSGWSYYHTASETIRTEDFTEKYSAKAYLKITYTDNSCAYVIAGYDSFANTRTVGEVSSAAAADLKAEKTDIYCYAAENNLFSPYTEAELNILKNRIG